MKVALMFLVMLTIDFAIADDLPIYVQESGLEVHQDQNGKVIHLMNDLLWKYKKEKGTETFIKKSNTDKSFSNEDTTVYVAPIGSDVVAISKTTTIGTDRSSKTSIYTITNGKSYLKSCKLRRSGKSSCDLVSAEMCGKLYAQTDKMKTAELDRCTDLMREVNTFHADAIKNFDDESKNALSDKFKEASSFSTNKTGDYVGIRGLTVLGGLCRDLRCRQGDRDCLTEDFFPTSDRPTNPQAKPMPAVPAR